MTLPLFYADDGVDITTDVIELSGPAAHHAHTVVRMGPGERLILADGEGSSVTATIRQTDGSGKSVVMILDVEERHTESSPSPALHLIQALAKQDRDLQAIETATEYGVDVVSPFQAEHSVVRWKGPRAEKSWQKWQNLLTKASQQARRSRIVQLTPLVTAKDITQWCAEENTVVLIMDEQGHQSIHEFLDGVPEEKPLASYERIIIVIGPEGGFSSNERTSWYEAGAQGIKLGDIIMRASSAGPAGIAALNLLLKRW